jgi:hypothetical protein
MKQELNESEDKRAYRISFRINACHQSLTIVYETLVDREFSVSEKEIKQIITELRLMLKSMQNDDF